MDISGYTYLSQDSTHYNRYTLFTLKQRQRQRRRCCSSLLEVKANYKDIHPSVEVENAVNRHINIFQHALCFQEKSMNTFPLPITE